MNSIIHNTPRWKPYPAYKPSGVAWLGEIPAHWEVLRLKYTVDDCQNGMWGDEPKGTTDDIICVRVADFDRVTSKVRDTEFTLRAVPVSQRRGRELQTGDLLLEKSGGGELQPVGKVVLYDLSYQAICSNFIARMRPLENYDARFLTYLFDAAYAGRLNVNSLKQNTGIQNLDSDSYLSERAAFPPLPEQRAIAAFLDRETARLDTLIAKKEQLIERLQEKRTALISRAVTKGLDAHARMKDSGVEWLGEVPEHWAVSPLYARYTIQLGKMLSQESVKGISPAPYLRNTNIQWDRVDLNNLAEMDFDSTEQNKFRLTFGDLLVCEGGEVGRTAIWRDEIPECYFQKAVHRVRPNAIASESPRFLYYLLYTAASFGVFVAEGNRSTIVHLTAEKLRRHRFGFPPLEEQVAIVELLDEQTTRLDALVSKIREGIERLREYRGALIAAAVTGKIDVVGDA